MLRAPSAVTYSVAIGVGVTLVYWCYRQWKNRMSMPKKWRRIGTLDQINIFPIKSCGPLNLDANTEVDCDILGLKFNGCRDRALMVINHSNEMITARVYPHMVLIATELVESQVLQISAPGMNSIKLQLSTLKSEGEQIETKVWSTSVNVYLVGAKYDKWLSQYILNKDSGIRLVHYPLEKPVKAINSRMVRQPYILKEDRGTFNDATSYMLLNLSSIEELSTRLPRSLDPLQFRGNFHLKMDFPEPYAEDNWKWVKIGDDVVFRVVAPCTRCIFPNIDVKTAKRDPDGEPFNTLKKYRLFKGYASPALGIHLGLRAAGSIKKGAVIYVEDK
ncbi:mitochondrial amidoxime-reducing component 1-like [Anastrepha obliqua]|uniref:mitochondrial amidoxime-reducing component 1-like n=1 Tax=Anastrepha obliqua TaxID=95512 RepID=UPI002409F903|nr:mitochondrial amidoxime-reducing component 1-like [Anastrepha obliqua]